MRRVASRIVVRESCHRSWSTPLAHRPTRLTPRVFPTGSQLAETAVAGTNDPQIWLLEPKRPLPRPLIIRKTQVRILPGHRLGGAKRRFCALAASTTSSCSVAIVSASATRPCRRWSTFARSDSRLCRRSRVSSNRGEAARERPESHRPRRSRAAAGDGRRAPAWRPRSLSDRRVRRAAECPASGLVRPRRWSACRARTAAPSHVFKRRRDARRESLTHVRLLWGAQSRPAPQETLRRPRARP